jgi:hypothetical protein
MKYNINVIKSVWRQWRKPSRATLDAISSRNSRKIPPTQGLDSAMWQHVARLEADRRDLLTVAKAVVHLRDMDVHPRPSSEMIRVLRNTISTVERRNSASRSD